MTGKDPWSGRDVCTDTGGILGGAYEGDPPVWFGDVGYDPPYGAKLGGVTPPRRPALHREAPTTTNVRGFLYLPHLGDALR